MHLMDLNPIEMEVEPAFDPLNDIVYHLFTRRNPTQSQVISYTNMDSVRNSNWNPNNPVRLVIHGWNGGLSTSMNGFMTRDLLARDDHNVIVVVSLFNLFKKLIF